MVLERHWCSLYGAARVLSNFSDPCLCTSVTLVLYVTIALWLVFQINQFHFSSTLRAPIASGWCSRCFVSLSVLFYRLTWLLCSKIYLMQLLPQIQTRHKLLFLELPIRQFFLLQKCFGVGVVLVEWGFSHKLNIPRIRFCTDTFLATAEPILMINLQGLCPAT